MNRIRSWEFSSDGSQHGVRVEVDSALPGGGTLSVYTRGTSPFGEAGTSLTLAEMVAKPVPGPSIPAEIWTEITAFIAGDKAHPYAPSPALAVAPVADEVFKTFSWEEGYDWEFYYTITIYRDGILFKASGEAERGIGTQVDYQLFERPGGIRYPDFMSTGGQYFLFERWLNEWNELYAAT